MAYRAKINLRVMAGVAKPSPKMGQALGPLGINMMQFCKDFNAQTSHIRPDIPMRVVLIAFADRTFKFMVKPPPTSWFLKRIASRERCTEFPGHIINSLISIKYVYELAKLKKEIDPHLQHTSEESICRTILGQCSSMGLGVTMDQDRPEKPIKLNLKI